MTTQIEEYKREACRGNRGRIADAAADWAGVADWWASGRPLFVQAFQNEVGKRPSKAGIDNLPADSRNGETSIRLPRLKFP